MNRRRFATSICAMTLLSALDVRGDQGAAQDGGAGGQRVWPRPTIRPIPARVADCGQPVIDLAGAWKFTLNPPERFWVNSSDVRGWSDIQVPGECVTQGFVISRDSEYPFRKAVTIPAEFAGKRVFLRFDGVYSLARLWVNGVFVREHHGGFTSWEAEITELVKPGEIAWITLGVTDRADEISYGSHYAKHSIGGILRGVRLVALSPTHLTRLQVATDLDSSYRDAVLEVTAAAALSGNDAAAVRLHLEDLEGHIIPLAPATISLSPEQPENTVRIPIRAPKKWDAEHPNLYRLQAIVVVKGSESQIVTRAVGFRKIEVKSNELLVNGQPVKLRGVCRHSVDPLGGRSTPADADERDVILLRDANVNFVRTSHYPPTEAFLEACDRYGIYVEEETAVCFQLKEAGSTSDPEYTARFLNQFAEMIERDRSHPAVIFWSLGNESRWGSNIAKEFAYAHQEDTTRPVIFSYPDTVPVGTAGYDLFSMHYPQCEGDLRSVRYPKLNDEYAHVSCYNLDTLRRDPGVRNFWGESLKRFWENCFISEGCLGGAIWAGFDEVFLLPDGPVGYGYWGVVDGWRRQKPEYFLTRKAYSPIRVPATALASPGAGRPLSILIKNWFDHTDFREVTIEWKVADESGTLRNIGLAAHRQGVLTIPARAWQDGDIVNLKFFRAGGLLIDEHEVTIGRAARRPFPKAQGPAPEIAADANSITVSGKDFCVLFSKVTGLIARGTYRGATLIEGGPYLNLGHELAAQWWLDELSYSKMDGEAVIRLTGESMRGAGTFAGVEFEIRIDGAGLITTIYRLTSRPDKMNELGIAYLLTDAIESLSWERRPLWSAYPSDHIGRPKGVAAKTSDHPALAYRARPAWPWSQDTQDPFLFGMNDKGGRGSNDFRSMKENIWQASCTTRGGERVRAESAGLAAARAEVRPDGKIVFVINNIWGYTDLAWGNYVRPVEASAGYTNEVVIRMTNKDEG